MIGLGAKYKTKLMEQNKRTTTWKKTKLIELGTKQN